MINLSKEVQQEIDSKQVYSRIVECVVFGFKKEPLKAMVKLIGFPDILIPLTPLNMYIPIETQNKIDVKLPKDGVKGLAIFSVPTVEHIMDPTGKYGFFLGFPHDYYDDDIKSRLRFIDGNGEDTENDGIHTKTVDGKNSLDFGNKGFKVSNLNSSLSLNSNEANIAFDNTGFKLTKEDFQITAAENANGILSDNNKLKIFHKGNIHNQSNATVTTNNSFLENTKGERKIDANSLEVKVGGGVDFSGSAMTFKAISSKAARFGTFAMNFSSLQGGLRLSATSGDIIIKNDSMKETPAKILLGIGTGINFTQLRLSMTSGALLSANMGDIKLTTKLGDIILDALMKVEIKGKLGIDIKTPMKTKIEGKLGVDIESKIKTKIKGKIGVDVSGTKIDIKGDAKITIDAPQIELGKGTSGILTQSNNPILCPITGLSSVPVATIKAG